jgi:hypothetical protein
MICLVAMDVRKAWTDLPREMGFRFCGEDETSIEAALDDDTEVLVTDAMPRDVSRCSGPGIASNLHFALAFPEIPLLEWSHQFTDLQNATLSEPPVVESGGIQSPYTPGLGIHFDASLPQRFPFITGTAERASGLMIINDDAR